MKYWIHRETLLLKWKTHYQKDANCPQIVYIRNAVLLDILL